MAERRLPGRPKVYNDPAQIQVRIESVSLERLKAEAAARTVSVNYLVSRAVDAYLDELTKEPA